MITYLFFFRFSPSFLVWNGHCALCTLLVDKEYETIQLCNTFTIKVLKGGIYVSLAISEKILLHICNWFFTPSISLFKIFFAHMRIQDMLEFISLDNMGLG